MTMKNCDYLPLPGSGLNDIAWVRALDPLDLFECGTDGSPSRYIAFGIASSETNTLGQFPLADFLASPGTASPVIKLPIR